MASYHCSVKVGGLGKGAAHAAYISREGKYEHLLHSEKAEKLEHVESINMPEWAQARPLEFWEQADQRERKNGAVYREFELALPNELTPDQAVALVRDFVRNEIGEKHACTWAIHNGKSAIDGTVNNRNAHIMFSERLRDGIERGPDTYFKREAAAYRHRTTKEMIQPDAAARAKGGHGKLDTYNGTRAERRETLVALRARFADLTNSHLAQHGHTDRVTHLSLKDQGIDRMPEQHLGPKGARSPALTASLKEYRSTTAEAEQAQALAAEVVATHQQEQQHVRTKASRTRTRSTRRAQVQDVQRVDDIQDRAARSEVLLRGDEPDRLEQREAAADPRRVHELDADRAARVAADQRIVEAGLLMQKVRDLKKQAWRGQLAERRKDWQRPAVKLTSAPARAGQPVVHRWDETMGKAAGFAAVIDYGDRLKPAGRPENISDAKVQALLHVAQKKGWKEITVSGDEAFRQRVAVAATHAGLGLLDADLKAHVAPIVAAREAAEINRKFTADTLAKAEALAKQEAAKAAAVPAPSPSKHDPAAKPLTAREQAQQALQAVADAKARSAARRAARVAPVAKEEAKPNFWNQVRDVETRIDALAEQRDAIPTPTPSPSLPEPSTPAPVKPAPAPTIEDLKAEKKALLLQGAELAKQASDIAQRVQATAKPAKFYEDGEWQDSLDAAAADLNAEAERRGLPKAMPAHRHEYDSQVGWGRLRDDAVRELAEHDKSGRPWIGFGREAWDSERARLDKAVKLWEQRIVKRDTDWKALAAQKFAQKKAEHERAEAERPAKHEAALQEKAQHQERRQARDARLVEIDKQLPEKDRSRQNRTKGVDNDFKHPGQSKGGLSL